MNRLAPIRRFLALALALVLALGAVPAFAAVPAVAHLDPVPSHALIGGVDLFGKTADEAFAAIQAGSVVPSLSPITVKGDGHTMTFEATQAVYFDAAALLEQAYNATDTITPFELMPSVKPSVVTGWVNKLAHAIDRKAVNAKRTLSHKKLVVSAERVGVSVDKKTTARLISAAVRSEIASPAIAGLVVNASLHSAKPKVTRKNIGKAILIRLSKFTITLYNGAKIEKTYRCAIGMPAYPTPTGKFKVTDKVKFPTWHNPHSDWSARMPDSITGGLNNPLGTRAIYTSAPGIRMHGVPSSENWSIGHRASHGCLRMHRHDVEDFYPRVPVGIDVWIVN